MRIYHQFLSVLTILIFSNATIYSSVNISLSELKTEGKINPIGVDELQPAFSWILNSEERGQKQVGYQIIVASSEAKLFTNIGDIWNSEHVVSDRQINIIYQGPSLQSGTRYYWKVRVWDRENNVSNWSVTAWWEMGLLNSSDWQGDWITTATDDVCPLFREDFTISKTIKRATAHVYGLGWYEMHLNGTKVGDRVLTPANTKYLKRHLYDSYDVTDYLKQGGNTVGLWLAGGYGSTYSKYGWRWMDTKRAILQMNIEFTDGTRISIVTNKEWKSAPSQILFADIYNGETYDATKEKTGWDINGYNDRNWGKVATITAPPGRMESNMANPVRVKKIIKPVTVNQPLPGSYVFDLGQNIAGWVRLRVKGANRGNKIVIRHAEALNSDGSINIQTNRTALSTDSYICKGVIGEEIYEPRFTYHGFRYIEVKGYPGIPTLLNIEGCSIHSDVELTGNFSCSDSLINKIHSNFQWTLLNNMVSIPTDNPVRDERTPCQMDENCVYEAAINNYDMQQYFKNWLNNIYEDTSDPDWSAGQVLGPWLLYQYYGDQRVLERFYISSKKEVDYCIANEIKSNYWAKSFGDWCPPFTDGTYNNCFSEGEIVNTTLYYQITNLFSRIAGILGRVEDSTKYSLIANSILIAFNNKHLNNSTNIYGSGKQITYIMPLITGIVPSDKIKSVSNNLFNNVTKTNSGHFGAGIYGTSFLADVLCDYDHADVAYSLFKQTTYPGFGYQIINYNATTTWEQWDVIKTGNEMETYDHAMFSGADKTFYSRFGGIRPLTPGYKTICIKPCIPDGLTFVKSSVKTVMGLVTSNWRRSDDVYTNYITIPVNATAIVYIPGTDPDRVYENGVLASKADVVHYLRIESSYIVYSVESGKYFFTYGKPVKVVI